MILVVLVAVLAGCTSRPGDDEGTTAQRVVTIAARPNGATGGDLVVCVPPSGLGQVASGNAEGARKPTVETERTFSRLRALPWLICRDYQTGLLTRSEVQDFLSVYPRWLLTWQARQTVRRLSAAAPAPAPAAATSALERVTALVNGDVKSRTVCRRLKEAGSNETQGAIHPWCQPPES